MNLYFVYVVLDLFVMTKYTYLLTYSLTSLLTCVFLLDNFDNSIPKDGVDHELNVTHRHDWPNKNVRVLKSLSEKSQSI